MPGNSVGLVGRYGIGGLSSTGWQALKDFLQSTVKSLNLRQCQGIEMRVGNAEEEGRRSEMSFLP